MATQQSQIVNGSTYTPYSPEWYQAQQADTIRRQGVAGTAAGTGEANYLSALSPSLQGLYSAAGLGGRSSTTTGMPSEIGYPGGGGGSASFGADPVSSSGLTGQPSTVSSPTATIAPLNFDAANNAAFATAKDQAAKTASASMLGLNQALGARGMGGAGYEAGQVGNTLGREANTIGEAGRAQAINETNLRARAAEANLGAQVTQRGQDIGARESAANRALAGSEAAFSGGIAQRGQTIGANEAAANLAAERAAGQFSGNIAQRGQDIQSAESAANLAQQAAALKSQNTLAILRSVLGGGPAPNAGAYVY